MNIWTKTKLISVAVLLVGCGRSVSSAEEEIYVPAQQSDTTAPVIACLPDITITEDDIFNLEDYCTYKDDTSQDINVNVDGSIDTAEVGKQELNITVTDEDGNLAYQTVYVTVEAKPEPSPSEEPVSEPSYEPVYEPTETYTYTPPAETYTYTEPEVPASSESHGTKYYMFSDGYDMDSSFAACNADLNAIGYGSCTPLMSDGLYTGYVLSY